MACDVIFSWEEMKEFGELATGLIMGGLYFTHTRSTPLGRLGQLEF
jgi:hypothetical protein